MVLEEVKSKLKSEIKKEDDFTKEQMDNYGYYVGYNRGIRRALELLGMVNKTDIEEELESLKKQHTSDESRMKFAEQKIKFWEELYNYLYEKSIGDKSAIINAIAENDYNELVGYVKVVKSINVKQEVILEFEVGGIKYKAVWQPSDNYACWQTCGYMGDDYSGYLLFPTYNDDEYFCIYYRC